MPRRQAIEPYSCETRAQEARCAPLLLTLKRLCELARFDGLAAGPRETQVGVGRQALVAIGRRELDPEILPLA